jgi:hypothetical protein
MGCGLPRPPPKPADFPPTEEERASRLPGAGLAWGLFQHFYPYFEETNAKWPALTRPEPPRRSSSEWRHR